MSHENVEIVRRVLDAVARDDAATVLALYEPEVEWDISRSVHADVMGRGIYHGHEGLRSLFRQWYEAWESVEPDFDELIDAGEHVISVARWRGRGRTSGVVVEGPVLAGVWTIRNGKIIRVVWFPTREEAAEAAGLAQ